MAFSRELASLAIFDGTFNKLQESMIDSTKRQATIAHNIANADTPGFEAMEFDKVLKKAVVRTENKKVVLEEEMAALADNSIRYSTYVKLLSSKINILKTVASQGRK